MTRSQLISLMAASIYVRFAETRFDYGAQLVAIKEATKIADMVEKQEKVTE